MATITAIAIKREKAMERLAQTKPEIERILGIEAVAVPIYERDPALLHAEQLTAFADFFDRVLEKIKQNSAAAFDYDALTVAELRALGDERGVNLPDKARKEEIIAVLKEADVMNAIGKKVAK